MIVLRFPTPTHFRVRALEWGLAGIMASCAVVLAQPEATFANPYFRDIARIASETVWTWALFIVAAARLFALYVNGAWRPSPWVRLAASLASALFWTQLLLGIVGVGGMPLGLAFFPWFICADLYSMMRAGQDARLSAEDRAAKPEAPLPFIVHQ